jgi:hypothetical protein
VALERAIAIAADAHRSAMRDTRPGMFEYELEALIDYTFRRSGATGPAYPSIVASGANATILHYVENTRQMHDGELLLIDAGAEWGGYCADVTRTAPRRRALLRTATFFTSWCSPRTGAAIVAVAPGARSHPHQRAPTCRSTACSSWLSSRTAARRHRARRLPAVRHARTSHRLDGARRRRLPRRRRPRRLEPAWC